MSASRTRTRGRNCGLFVVCTLLLAHTASAQGCEAPQLVAEIGRESSRWVERDNQGRQLVSESGPLDILTIGASSRCFGLQWDASAKRAQGRRDYMGVSTTGGAIQTSSGISQTQWQLQARLPLSEPWWLGARLAHQDIARDLQGVGAVQGYPERFRYWRAALGSGYRLWQGEGTELQGQAWIGGGPAGRMELRLTGDDPATLTLGNNAHASLALDWRSRRASDNVAGWSWHAGVTYALEQIEAGAAQPISRNGLVVAAALQPQTRITGLVWTAGVHYQF